MEVSMDWKKVEELRKKVLAEEEALVNEAIEGDKRRKKLGAGPNKKGRKSGGVRDLEEEQTRKLMEHFGWDPKKAAKRKRLPKHMRDRQKKRR
jgi:hypothetical protein